MLARLFGRVHSWLSDDALPTTRPQSPTSRLAMEPLETRETPTVSSITSNFNGTAIAAGNILWFNSVAKVSGVPAAGTTVQVTNQTVSFNGTVISLPDTTLTLSPTTAAADATTAFSGGWVTTSPRTFSGNVFVGGTGYQVPATIPGGSVKSITWSGDFKSTTPGVTLNWQWSAAVYTAFSSDPSQLGVKPTDTATKQYGNSDHAGTPEAFKKFVVGGARGGGGSNYTGSYSSTGSVVTDAFVTPPPPPSAGPAGVSGYVFTDLDGDGVADGGRAGVTLLLYNGSGALVATTTTDESGYYSFTGLAAGTYSLSLDSAGTVKASVGYVDGTGDGTANGSDIMQVGLDSNQFGVNYNFLVTPTNS